MHTDDNRINRAGNRDMFLRNQKSQEQSSICEHGFPRYKFGILNCAVNICVYFLGTRMYEIMTVKRGSTSAVLLG